MNPLSQNIEETKTIKLEPDSIKICCHTVNEKETKCELTSGKLNALSNHLIVLFDLYS